MRLEDLAVLFGYELWPPVLRRVCIYAVEVLAPLRALLLLHGATHDIPPLYEIRWLRPEPRLIVSISTHNQSPGLTVALMSAEIPEEGRILDVNLSLAPHLPSPCLHGHTGIRGWRS